MNLSKKSGIIRLIQWVIGYYVKPIYQGGLDLRPDFGLMTCIIMWSKCDPIRHANFYGMVCCSAY